MKWLHKFWLLLACCAFNAHAGEPSKGYATLDWTVAETLIALGEKPVAVGDVKSYQQWVAVPALPNEVMDLGIRMQPNQEQLAHLARQLNAQPLHFINTSFYAGTASALEQNTAVEGRSAMISTVDFYQEGDAWQNVVNATEQVAQLIGKPAAFEQLMADFSQKIAEIRPLVAPFAARPIALVQFIDTRHLRIYGNNSPFGAVLKQLGLQNAWTGDNNVWGFETITITQLRDLAPHSRFVVVKPYPSDVPPNLAHNSLWKALPISNDPLVLPAVWTFGGIPSAQRFAEVLAHGLSVGGQAW